MLLGIFGGSFDPVHKGHLGLARACHLQAGLDELWFMPTAVQPLKQHGPHASDADRIAMLRLAIEDETRAPGADTTRFAWRTSTLEIDRGGLSYTVDTLRQIHEELPDTQLFFPLGADTLRDVPRWKEPREIFRLATPLIVHRIGEADPDLDAIRPLCTPATQPRLIEMPSIDISSSEIRRRIAASEPIDGFVPPAVAAYIRQHALYR